MNFCKAITTPRDDVSTHDYLYPIIKETFKMTGGGNNNGNSGNGNSNNGNDGNENENSNNGKKPNNFYNNNEVQARAEARGKSRDKAYDIFVFVLPSGIP